MLSEVRVSLPHTILMSSSGESAITPPSASACTEKVLFTSKFVGTVIEYPLAVIIGAAIAV